jgi:DNA-binding MarR family transcriptional regulator
VPDPEVTATVLGRVIVQAGRQLDIPFGSVLDQHGLTRNAWWFLTELYRTRLADPVTVGEHARRAALAASSATVVTEQLTQRGLTRRWRPPDNRRIIYVTITDAGLATVEAVRADMDHAIAELYQLYDGEQRRTLHALLTRLVEVEEPLN